MLGDGFGLWMPVRIVLGGIAVAVAVYVQPFRRAPKLTSAPLTKDDAPSLFSLCDEVAGALGAKGLDGVELSPDFNASIVHDRRRGWVMTLGVALWSILQGQEKVALIGHELGHQVNRDQRRTLVVRGAINSLGRWAYLLRPAPIHRSGVGVADLAEVMMAVMLSPLTLLAAALHRLLWILASRQGLSAEYYADQLAAKVAGTEAGAALAEKLLIARACDRRVTHTAKFEPAVDPWREVAAYAASIPPHEWERQRRLGRLRLPAIDSTHPPNQLRADLMRRLTHSDAAVTLTAAQADAIERELSAPRAVVTASLHARFPY